MTILFTVSGDIPEAIAYVSSNRPVMWLLLIYTFLAYVAISFHMAIVKEFGGIVTVLVGNTRKALTIVFSFIFFPKPMSPLYLVGGLLVFGSLIGNAYMKEKYGHGRKKGGGEMMGV